METQYVPAERADNERIQHQHLSVLKASLFIDLFNAISECVLILNPERQIIFFNDRFLQLVDVEKPDHIYGMRPGEALDCINASRTCGGCGTSDFCRECGLLKAVLTTRNGPPDVQECRITRNDTGDALDLRIRTSPLAVSEETCTLVSLSDISHEKRRRVLERIFFHDIMNTAVALRGLSELLADSDPVDAPRTEMVRMVHSSAEKLVDEIQAQKDLTAAENNEYQLKLESIDSIDLLNRVIDVYRMHDAAFLPALRLAPDARQLVFTSDATLLFRVISNMTKNALEASGSDDTVTLGCMKVGESVQLWVHNPTGMPRNVQRQIFLRSYSTKGAGRGLGTYSIKLLSERYLNGRVSFTSSCENGTTFYAVYPMEWNR